MPAKIYTDKDADLKVLKGKTLAVLGFGSQGHAHALNLKESGAKVIIGLYPGSKSRKVAEDYGFKVYDTAEAVKLADVIMVGLPDTKQAAAYKKDIAPHLTKGKTLLFTHGFSIHFKTVVPPKDINVIMAKGVGGTRGGVIETTFKEETETDLFGEQTVLCGGASALVQAGFETLVEAGYAPEMAYFECLHELKLIVDLMNEAGIAGMRFSISETAKWGDVAVGPKIIDAGVKKRMKAALKDIQTGKFAKEWIAEYEGGYKKYNALLKAGEKHPIEKTGARLRGLMPWIKKRSIKGQQASYK